MKRIILYPLPNRAKGEPRYLLHFSALADENVLYEGWSVNQFYQHALELSHRFGGKQYVSDRFGGGIVFKTCNVNKLVTSLCGAVMSWEADRLRTIEILEENQYQLKQTCYIIQRFTGRKDAPFSIDLYEGEGCSTDLVQSAKRFESPNDAQIYAKAKGLNVAEVLRLIVKNQ